VPRTTRAAVLAKLAAKVARRQPIFIASAGSGLVARLLEQAGADCINTFPGARLRANGMGTMAMMWPILDSNRQTLEYTEQDILPALKGQAFVCACLNANDPLRDMRTVLERLKSMGVSRSQHPAVHRLRRQDARSIKCWSRRHHLDLK
jgi:predicted TIM-barrel enzyme